MRRVFVSFKMTRSSSFKTLVVALLLIVISSSSCSSLALLSTSDINPSYSKAILDLKESIVKGLGFQAEEIKINGLDPRETQVGHSVAYEFDVEIDNMVFPFKLVEDVNRWDYVDLPREEHELIQKVDSDGGLPVLTPFQLAGPMELWIKDAKDMRISLPQEIDAGELEKVILADGAVVTVVGARSVSLRYPLELPLPLNPAENGFAAGLLNLAEQLRRASRLKGVPLLSLCIVGPTSLTTRSSSSSTSSTNRLKLKRLAPGLVELSSPKEKEIEGVSALHDHDDAPVQTQFATFWPFASLNGSNSNLLGYEALLTSVLGSKADKKGSFKLSKADVSAQTFVKIGFEVEKKLKEGEGYSLDSFPEWRTKPETVKLQFEVLGKVDGDRVIPESVLPVNTVTVEDTMAPNMLLRNISMSKVPIFHPPSVPFTL